MLDFREVICPTAPFESFFVDKPMVAHSCHHVSSAIYWRFFLAPKTMSPEAPPLTPTATKVYDMDYNEETMKKPLTSQ